MSKIIDLTNDEGMAAASVAVLQQFRALQKGWLAQGKDTSYPPRSISQTWGDRIEGMLAEVAVCKALNVAWFAGIAGLNGADAGSRILIRSTPIKYMHSGHHFVTLRDSNKHPNAASVAVAGCWPRWTIIGWVSVADAMRPEWLRTKEQGSTEDSYWVPMASLRIDWDELAKYVDRVPPILQ